MFDLDQLLELLAAKCGFPSPKKIIEARAFVNHTFPDLRSRQAFLGTTVSTMCEEFDVDLNSLLDSWKEVL